MGRLRNRRLGRMASRVASLSGSLAGSRGGGGGWKTAPKGEATENALILGASLAHTR